MPVERDRSGKQRADQSPTVRISAADKLVLDELARETNESHPRLLHRAIELLRREKFFQEMNAAYAELRRDPEAWLEEAADRQLFDGSTSEGLQEE